MSSREAARQRTERLKELREQHRETVARTQAQLKAQQEFRRQLCQALRAGPKTVPDLAQATGLPADQVLWHITAMKKYGQAAETGQCGEYYLYALAQEKQT
jgi:predicted Rossmann fold nucleotide-binding protein DprA/Smf involved in DNA uptake